ncbi:MAG: hypothetical protein H7319_20555 [Spirosoma sp.]|nr:hypothetical protein [Spirosoma sp.]
MKTTCTPRLTAFLLAMVLIGCAPLRFNPHRPPCRPAAYILRSAFEKQDRIEQNKAFLHDRLIELSRYLDDLATADPVRYRIVERAYVEWSQQTGYGEDLSRLDASDNRQVQQVLVDIDRFKQAARPAHSRTPYQSAYIGKR